MDAYVFVLCFWTLQVTFILCRIWLKAIVDGIMYNTIHFKLPGEVFLNRSFSTISSPLMQWILNACLRVFVPSSPGYGVIIA